MFTRSLPSAVMFGIVALAGARARAQEPEPAAPPEGADDAVEVVADPNAPGAEMPEPYGPPPIPPGVEEQPQAGPGGSYCYGGPHPVDTRAAGGTAWDDAQGPHTHFYPPFDLRLFTLRDGCYYFIGDPADFGYQGQTYGYYGAHPIYDGYGGGWCFMIGPHTHVWAPWSASFVPYGSWYYWSGAYDSTFWWYWPYYSFYYRAYYPRYYGGGRFWRGGGVARVAPRINHVPPAYARGWHGTAAAPVGNARGGAGWSGGGNWRGSGTRVAPAAPYHAPVNGSATSAGGWRGGAPATTYHAAPSTSGTWRGGAVSTPAPQPYSPPATGWHGNAPGAAPQVSTPAPHFSAPARSSAPSPSSSHPVSNGASHSTGGWHKR